MRVCICVYMYVSQQQRKHCVRMVLPILVLLSKQCTFVVEQPHQSLLYRHRRWEWLANRVAIVPLLHTPCSPDKSMCTSPMPWLSCSGIRGIPDQVLDDAPWGPEPETDPSVQHDEQYHEARSWHPDQTEREARSNLKTVRC